LGRASADTPQANPRAGRPHRARRLVESEREPEREQHERHYERLAHQLAVEVDQQPVGGGERRGHEGRAPVERTSRDQIREADRSGAEPTLEQAGQQQVLAEHAKDRAEEPCVERRAEVRAARHRCVLATRRDRARPLDVERRIEDRQLVRRVILERPYERDAQREPDRHQRGDDPDVAPIPHGVQGSR
jgi:hypothetical protein